METYTYTWRFEDYAPEEFMDRWDCNLCLTAGCVEVEAEFEYTPGRPAIIKADPGESYPEEPEELEILSMCFRIGYESESDQNAAEAQCCHEQFVNEVMEMMDDWVYAKPKEEIINGYRAESNVQWLEGHILGEIKKR